MDPHPPRQETRASYTDTNATKTTMMNGTTSTTTTTAVAAATTTTMPTSSTSTTAQKMAPPSVAPRLEIKSYHEALKGALTKENWMTYTEALNKFLRGVELPSVMAFWFTRELTMGVSVSVC